MAANLTDAERVKIVAHLKNGKSQTWTAKQVGRSKDTVGRICREEGIETDGRQTKKATEAAAAFREIERMEIIHDILASGQDLLSRVTDPKDYKDVVTGLAIGIDKHRLETGEATSRTENVDPERKRKMRESLDELAARRRLA